MKTKKITTIIMGMLLLTSCAHIENPSTQKETIVNQKSQRVPTEITQGPTFCASNKDVGAVDRNFVPVDKYPAIFKIVEKSRPATEIQETRIYDEQRSWSGSFFGPVRVETKKPIQIEEILLFRRSPKSAPECSNLTVFVVVPSAAEKRTIVGTDMKAVDLLKEFGDLTLANFIARTETLRLREIIGDK